MRVDFARENTVTGLVTYEGDGGPRAAYRFERFAEWRRGSEYHMVFVDVCPRK